MLLTAFCLVSQRSVCAAISWPPVGRGSVTACRLNAAPASRPASPAAVAMDTTARRTQPAGSMGGLLVATLSSYGFLTVAH